PPRAGPVEVRAKGSGAIEGGEDLARALAEAALPRIAQGGAVAEALRAARAGEIDAVDLGLRLHDAVEGRPEVAAALVPELAAERRGDIALKIAQTLAAVEADDELRRATIEALSRSAEAREVGLLALLRRGERPA